MVKLRTCIKCGCDYDATNRGRHRDCLACFNLENNKRRALRRETERAAREAKAPRLLPEAASLPTSQLQPPAISLLGFHHQQILQPYPSLPPRPSVRVLPGEQVAYNRFSPRMNASLHERQKAQQALPRRRPQQPPPAPPQHPILPPVPTITNRATALALIPDRFTHVRQPILAHGSRAALTTALYAFLFSLDEDRRDTIKTVMAALNAPMDDAEIADGTRSQTACREFARRIAIRLDTIFANAERAEA